jgi:DNA-binding GntR family transcriptional regulator
MRNSVFRKNSRTTLTLQALKQMKNAIETGLLKPGDRVIEADMAKKMNISRFPVREAIRLLEKEGLLVSIPFKGAFVPHFNEKDLEELYTLRSSLEELAIRILMEKAKDETIKKLEPIVQAMEKATKMKKGRKLVAEDMKFHRTLCELSGHTKLLEVWKTLEHQLKCFIAIEELSYEKEDELVKTHYPVLEAIRSGNTLLAERSIREHLLNALAYLKSLSRSRNGNHGFEMDS